MAQAVAAKVEQLEVFGQQELFGPEMFDNVTGQIHLHYVRWQVRRDVIQIWRGRKKDKDKVMDYAKELAGERGRLLSSVL